MIIGLGTDLLSQNRVGELFNKFNSKFVNKILSYDEISLFNNIIKNKQINFLAKRFSAKEAILKACGIGLGRGILLKDISILNNNAGKPEVIFNNNSMKFLGKLYNIDYNNLQFNISITDEQDLVNAVAIISKK